MQICEGDKLTKDVCELCQNKLEFCRQYFEQIFNAHLKLLSLLREGEEAGPGTSVEEEMLRYMRTYAEAERPRPDTEPAIFSCQPREIVKCEPELPDLHDEERREVPLRDPKHFLDELLDEYEDTEPEEKKVPGKGRRKSKLLVPPPLRKCAECGLVSASHLDNLAHWAAAHPAIQPVVTLTLLYKLKFIHSIKLPGV